MLQRRLPRVRVKKNISIFEEDYFREVYDRGRRVPERLRVRNKDLMLLLSKKPEVVKILDVGCGYGEFLELAKRKNLQVWGIEISKFASKLAKKKLGESRILQLDAQKVPWPFPQNFFDAVTLFDVLEHVRQPQRLIEESFRVLAKSGVLFITTPNNQGRLGKILERWMPDDPTHINKRQASEWEAHLKKAGFQSVESWGVILHGFPPGPGIRGFLEKWGISTIVSPIRFPLKFLCGTLNILARKP